jgi:hypothetical protein
MMGLLPAPTSSWAQGQAQAPGNVAAPDPLGGYLAELERTGRLPAEVATLARLRERLAEAEERLIQGDARAAAAGLFALVEAPRFAPFADTVPFQNAELMLARALLRGGATLSAERYFVRILRRGPKGPFYVPAHRGLVDLALTTRDYQRVLESVLGPLAAQAGGALPEDARAERAYLQGRIHHRQGQWDAAAVAFAQVPRTSRLYANAAYFRGLVAAQRGVYKDARGAFCEILPDKDGGSLAFVIDGRYYQMQDLARLALGRIAHEQDRYDEAYYFYFSVPEESDRLAEALFEAAHSMYQKGETVAARTFVEAFDRSFPDAPQRAEVALLRANLALKSCAFDVARREASDLVSRYQSVQLAAARAALDPTRARRLIQRLLTKPDAEATADEDGRMLSLLKLDDRFATLKDDLAQIDLDIQDARDAHRGWRALAAVAQRQDATLRTAASAEAAQLLSEVEALAADLRDAPELTARTQALLARSSLLAHPPRSTGPYASEEAAAAQLLDRLVDLRERMLGAADAVIGEAFTELDDRLRTLFRRTRLVHIDAVVGHKKRLEIEIEALRAGRYGRDLYAKLKAEGTLADDEEYWPFEGEYWSDEYENFK